VELNPGLAEDLRTKFGVLLTEHGYSRAEHDHVLLPIHSGEDKQADDRVLQIRSKPWIAVFSPSAQVALVPVSTTQSVWYTDDIARETEYVLDDESLRQIDARLCEYFSLPPLDAELPR
jgi:hypothetical protein